MMMSKNAEQTIINIYQNANTIDRPKSAFGWIHSLNKKQVSSKLTEKFLVQQKDILKTESKQIGHNTEELDQRNRQAQIQLQNLKIKNDYLRQLHNQSENELQKLKYSNVVNDYQKLDNFLDTELTTKNCSSKSSINNNLELCIFFSDQESQKINANIIKLRKTPEFYNLFEMLNVGSGYREEVARLTSVIKVIERAKEIRKEKMKYHSSEMQGTLLRKIKMLTEKNEKLNEDMLYYSKQREEESEEIVKLENLLKNEQVKHSLLQESFNKIA